MKNELNSFVDVVAMICLMVLICHNDNRPGQDHIYRMVIVEGCCTMARSSSFRIKLFIG